MGFSHLQLHGQYAAKFSSRSVSGKPGPEWEDEVFTEGGLFLCRLKRKRSDRSHGGRFPFGDRCAGLARKSGTWQLGIYYIAENGLLVDTTTSVILGDEFSESVDFAQDAVSFELAGGWEFEPTLH